MAQERYGLIHACRTKLTEARFVLRRSLSRFADRPRSHLVLGSAPDPTLPSSCAGSTLVCVNGSGWSARRLGIPRPDLTIMPGSILNEESSAETREALCGLRRATLVYVTIGATIKEARSILSGLDYGYERLQLMSPRRKARIMKQLHEAKSR